jgi:hypothetical protein
MSDHTLLKQAMYQLECALLSTRQTMLTEEMHHGNDNPQRLGTAPETHTTTQHAIVQTNITTLPPKYVPAAGATYTSTSEGELSWRSSLRRPW